MTDCHSLADPKLKTRPNLYLPQDVPMPPQVKALETQCNLEVERLPRPIHRLGDVKVTEIHTPGLLYLPNKYVVPGGRFNEMYGWDSYFIILGLTSDGRIELARGIVENFFYEIEHYGAILNANRTYHLTRSQPPFLTSMIRAVYNADVALHPGNRKQDEAWVRLGYQYAERDHALWESELHRAGDTGLAHYEDIGAGPVPEMEDDSTYYPDVIRWLLDHPDVHTDYLVDGPESATPDQQEHLTEISCDPRISAVCARAHVDRHWLTREFYRGDRAMRESGFDPSFRFGPFSGSTQHFAPVCLNSLLYKYERDLAWMANLSGKADEAARWNGVAQTRKAAMDKYLWNPAKGMYFDYDYTNHKPSGYVYISTLYPLWAGAADKQQVAGVEQNLKLLERPGGIAMSTTDSGTQWDLPFGWAPCSWIAIQGLAISGDLNDAQRISKKFMNTIQEGFQQDRTIREKYNVVSGNSDVRITTGYKMNVVGFGWTNAVYLQMQHLMTKSGSTSATGGAQ
jgi:alpha,alpha-trehalase